MSKKPSYIGALNAIANGERGGQEIFEAWAAATGDLELRPILLKVAIREAEHAVAFEKRLAQAQTARNDPPPPAGPQPMEARALIAFCKDKGFEALAPALIEVEATQEMVNQRLALAGEVQDMLVAAGMESLQPQMLAAALEGSSPSAFVK